MALNFCNNNSLSAITALPASISGGGLNLISTQTASSSSTISFTSGIDSTYKEYIIKLINVHNASGDTGLLFNLSIDGGSNYNVTKTSTFVETHHRENGTDASIQYRGTRDLSQSTSDQKIVHDMGDGNDECLCGTLHLFDPSNTNFVKHFISVFNNATHYEYSYQTFIAGYANTTSAVNGVKWTYSSGNVDSATVKLYGLKDS